MNPEENSQPRATAEEPLIPEPLAPALESPAPESPVAEPLDDHTFTPPHGDALTADVAPPVEVEPAEPEVPAFAPIPPIAEEAPEPAPVFPVAEPALTPVELSEDHTATPPHGDPLPVEPSTEEVFSPGSPAVEPSPAPAELPDDHTATPPHGDLLPTEPVQEGAAVEPAAPMWTAPESVSPVSFAPAEATPVPDAPFTRDEVGAEPEPVVASGLEPAGLAASPAESFAEAAPDPYGTGMAPAPSVLAHETMPPAGPWGVVPGADGVGVTPGGGAPGADELEAAAVMAEPSQAPEEPVETGPNWMLAFICAWTGVTSLNEARVLLSPGGFRPELLHNYGFLGYVLLGLGLLFFALEALRWGKPGRSVGLLFLPSVLTLAGVVLLVLWNDPGRRI